MKSPDPNPHVFCAGDLVTDPIGSGWLVTESMGAVATARFWQLLLETAAYAN